AAQPGAARGRRARRARRRRPPRRLDPAGRPNGLGCRSAGERCAVGCRQCRRGRHAPRHPDPRGTDAAGTDRSDAGPPACHGARRADGHHRRSRRWGRLLLAGGTLELSGVGLPVLLALVLVAARARDAAKGPMPLSLMTPIPTPQGDLSVLSVLVWQADALLLAVLAGAVLAGLLMLL